MAAKLCIVKHQVPDAPDDEEECLAAIAAISDSGYASRYNVISTEPTKFPDWKIECRKMYRHRPGPIIDDIIEDSEAWK